MILADQAWTRVTAQQKAEKALAHPATKLMKFKAKLERWLKVSNKKEGQLSAVRSVTCLTCLTLASLDIHASLSVSVPVAKFPTKE